jgi:glycosyltransferase involved in cell wall biosynthesis
VRIVFVSGYGLPHLGGIEVAVDSLARVLAGRGHDVVHVTSAAVRPDDPPARNGTPPPYRVVRIPAWNGPEQRRGIPWPLFSPALLPALGRELAGADVVHAHGFLYMGTLAALARPRAGVVRVLTEHVGHVGYDSRAVDRVQALAIATAGRFSARRADAIVVLSRKVEAEMRRLAGGRPVEFIPNGVDGEAYRPADAAERAALRESLGWDERPRLLFAGRLVAKKGIGVALDAAARLGGERCELVVVGPGEPDHPVPPNARILGAQQRERVAELMRAADAFVLPSTGEGFPITAQEAMASGLPVVLGDDPSYAEYAGGGVFLAPPEAEAVAGVLAPLVDDPEFRARAATAAREQSRRYSWEAAADSHERLYERLRAP